MFRFDRRTCAALAAWVLLWLVWGFVMVQNVGAYLR